MNKSGFKVNTIEFKNNGEKLHSNLKERNKTILKRGVKTFVNWAAIYVPPDIGQKEIVKKRYTRPLLYLPVEVKKGKNKDQAEDISMLKRGFLYKVYRKITGTKRFKAYYFKRIDRKCKACLKIVNRGLLRASFGSNVDSIGVALPANIKRLLRKSKRLKTISRIYNKFVETYKDDKLEIGIFNSSEGANQNSNYAKIAIKQGDKKANQQIKRELRKIARENKEI